MSDSLQPHGLQHTRPSSPSPTPRIYPNSCPLSQRCHPTISSSAIPFSSRLQSFPASGSFPVSEFFALGSQSIRAFSSAQLLSHVRLLATPGIAVHQASCPSPAPGVYPNSYLMRRVDSLEKNLMLGGIGGRRRRGRPRMRWLYDITDLMDMSLSELRELVMDGRPGVLRFLGSPRVRHD